MTKATHPESAFLPSKTLAMPVTQEQANLDAVLAALEAVVLTQKAQIDALLASLEGLQAAFNRKTVLEVGRSCESWSQPAPPDATLLGNPLDPQFASMHELLDRLRRG